MSAPGSPDGGRPRRPRLGGGSLVRTWLLFIGIAALLVPLLPVAPPARPDLEDALSPPRFSPLFREGFDRRGVPAPGATTRWLLDARESLFGSWELGPVMGTDSLGRCVLSRTLWGARPSLLAGLVASGISLVIGVLFGGVAGFVGGRTDAVMMRLLDFLYALPLMFIVIFVVAFLRAFRQEDPDLMVDQEIVLFAVIGAVSWLVMARIVRGQVLSLRQTEFVLAARVAGAGPGRILLRHLLPNVVPVVLVTLTLTIPRVMLMEAFLSFLGLGIEPPDVSWGLLARQGFDAITAVHVSWWLILFPSLALGLTLLGLNILGDGLRDALDPRLRRRAAR